MGITPAQSVEGTAGEGIPRLPEAIDGLLLEELWQQCDGASCGLERGEFNQILLDVGTAQNYGLAAGLPLRASNRLLISAPQARRPCAGACLRGRERTRMGALCRPLRQPLVRAAIAITGNYTLGRELADQLYAELFGLTKRDGERRCPLQSYRGRGSLIGWLRTTLAQRHVDHHRRSHREQPLAELDAPAPAPELEKPAAELTELEKALEAAFERASAEDRFLLAAYYLDERTLLQIAKVLNVHEATVSRKLRRMCHNSCASKSSGIFRALASAGGPPARR